MTEIDVKRYVEQYQADFVRDRLNGTTKGTKGFESDTIKRTIDFYVSEGDVDSAADVAWHVGQRTRSVQLYLDAKMYDKAAETAWNAGNPTQSVMIYVNADMPHQAAQTAARMGEYDHAFALYDSARERYIQLGDFENVAMLFAEERRLKASLGIPVREVSPMDDPDHIPGQAEAEMGRL